ncbi:MAG: DUF2703 domain-containing protein [Methanospirillum sp.]|nr:DUF2703 domain-containing protein [Methanospirillum sp.]
MTFERRLDLEWHHRPGTTRSRIAAADTGRTVLEVIEEIRPTLEKAGVPVRVSEYLDEGDEEMMVNGLDLGQVLVRVKESHDYCHARSRREEMDTCRHPLAEDPEIAAGYTEFMLRKALLLVIEGED